MCRTRVCTCNERMHGRAPKGLYVHKHVVCANARVLHIQPPYERTNAQTYGTYSYFIRAYGPRRTNVCAPRPHISTCIRAFARAIRALARANVPTNGSYLAFGSVPSFILAEGHSQKARRAGLTSERGWGPSPLGGGGGPQPSERYGPKARWHDICMPEGHTDIVLQHVSMPRRGILTCVRRMYTPRRGVYIRLLGAGPPWEGGPRP